MKLRYLVATWFSIAFFAIPSNPANATLNLSVLDATLQVGNEGTIDVEISGTGDLVTAMALHLQITPIGGVGSSLVFVDPQTINFRNDASYLFFGDSFNNIAPSDPRFVFQTTLQQDTFQDVDGTNSGSNVTVTGNRLLGRITLRHIIPFGTLPGSVVGDTFLVSVIGRSGDLTETVFLDDGLNSIEFNSTRGTVRLQATAVPEPGSVVALTALTALAIYRRRRSLRR